MAGQSLQTKVESEEPSQASDHRTEELPLACADEQALRRQMEEQAVELENLGALVSLTDEECGELAKQNQALFKELNALSANRQKESAPEAAPPSCTAGP